MNHRRLIVVRHAKAEAPSGPDHARSLTAGGRRAASGVGAWLSAQAWVPDYALVSSATRTRQTWSAIAAELGVDVHAEFSDNLYHAGPDDVIESLRWVPVDARTVIYVGHNPTAGELPLLLDDGSGDRRALTEIMHGYPTSATSIFDVPAEWQDLRLGQARLLTMFVGAR